MNRLPGTVRAGALLALASAFLPVSPAIPAEPTSAIAVEISGNTSEEESRLRSHLEERIPALWETPSPAMADDAAFVLKRHYDGIGYPEASVGWTFSPGSVAFAITEGRKLFLTGIDIPEDLPIPAETLRALVAASFSGNRRVISLPGGAAPIPFSPTSVASAVKAVEATFAAQGYLDVVAVADVAEDGPVDRRLNFTILPGPKYQLAAEDITVISGDSSPELREMLDELAEEPYRSSTGLRLRARVLDYYRGRGFEGVSVREETLTDPETGRARVTLWIEPGTLYHLGAIRAVGGERTAERRIVKFARIEPGDLYNAAELDAARQKLLMTGAFEEVSFETAPPVSGKPGELDLVWRVKEAKARRIGLTAGGREWDGAFGELEFTDSNLFGSLRRFRATLFASGASYAGELSLRDPGLIFRDTPLTVRLFASDRSFPDYDYEEIGGAVVVERQVTEAFKLTGEWLMRKAIDTATSVEEIPRPPQDYTLSTLTLKGRLDQSDSLALPTKGYILESQVGGTLPGPSSEIRYLEVAVSANAFMEVGPVGRWKKRPMVMMSAGANSAFVDGGISQMPYEERFFLGGSDSVRSFPRDELGPSDRKGTPTGGLSSYQATLEFLVPLGGPFYLATFTDVGALSRESGWGGGLDARYAVGSGLRIRTPLGAIRFDAALNPNPQEGETVGAFHFGVGFRF